MTLNHEHVNQFLEEWQPLQGVDQKLFAETRLQIHWAAQAVASIGEGLVPSQPDFSHTNLGWDSDQAMLITHAFMGSARVGLGFRDLSINVLNAQNQITEKFILVGHTLQEALEFLGTTLPAAASKTLSLPTYELPPHEVSSGAKFLASDEEAADELAHWYTNANLLLGFYQKQTPTASPVRCWPHHFDIATLTVFDLDHDPEQARSIGFGMTPGDASYDEPYFYINPWPRPECEKLPELAGGGVWHVEGWFGAVLPAHRINPGTGPEQAQQVLNYTESALAAGLGALEIL